MSPRLLTLLIGASSVLHGLLLLAGRTWLQDWRWIHHPLHAVVESAGALVALGSAPLLIYLDGRGRGTSHNLPIANALVAMGILDGAHAMVSAGNAFVWLHSIATLLGGLIFALIWIPRGTSSVRLGPGSVAALALAIAVVSIAWPHAIPKMVTGSTFTLAARLANLAGGFCFFAAAARLMRSYRQARKVDDLLFIVHCALFGAAAIMFEASALWDAPWWGWHALRLMAYLFALWFLIDALRGEARVLETKTRELERKSRELERSNADLQQFIYVASHDLQEPLRQVASFTELLARRYDDQLDDRAHGYINHAVEGALRMQQLLNDLLDFARLDKQQTPLAPTDCNLLVEQVLIDLQAAIEDSDAQVSCDRLPSVMADRRQLVRVFRNLIANALKFRSEEPPRVHVSATREPGAWVFSIEDNGIGIDASEAGRLFQMFQRLHVRGTYPGTGIGLAIAKKVVHRHHGRIWFESQPDAGTTFYFTVSAPAENAAST